ncbi:aspartic proteinase 36-like isoform X1 [Arachis stenosperma]|uniref:aspartic proteinase 36-like isoform X1 n=1 Tax=Arachis stenosperma TaxID=217475 RepID=UPI0025ABADA6|nr:aspartic proteinase 36-like isoform X1 [Arachis stenosperma]
MRCSLTAVVFVLATVVATVVDAGVLLPLERAVPTTGSRRVDVEYLRARDRARHARILRGSGGGGYGGGGVVDFSVQGTSDLSSAGYGLYFTKVKMGTPPKEFNVQIDTGSDILWVSCNTCSNCPQSSGLGIELNYFDTVGSSTAALVPCSDSICASEVQGAAAECSQANQCSYTFQYGDGSGTTGYYVSDAMYFDMILGQSSLANSSATVVFGCSNYLSGELTKSDKAVDGIIGFGPGPLSVVSQLSSRGITPKVFSHCLKGDGNGGGILVLGHILDPNIVYTPLLPSQPHYNVNLQGISVNGQPLSINADVFATSANRGTIVDSGTTLAYLIQEAYDPLVNAITTAVSQSTNPFISKGLQCYLLSTSISDIFPQVSLNFEGGASMVLKPEQYLMHNGVMDGQSLWCIGFEKVQEGVSILGDLVLKDKVIIYDLAHQQIGWANYDCSSPVNVSVATSKDEYINARQTSVSGVDIGILSKLLPVSVVALSVHIAIFSPFL